MKNNSYEFELDEYSFKKVTCEWYYVDEKDPVYTIERDGKYGIALIYSPKKDQYEIIIACEFDNIFVLEGADQVQFRNEKQEHNSYVQYFILCKSGRQGLLGIQYGIQEDRVIGHCIIIKSEIEFDSIDRHEHSGYLLHKRDNNRFFSKINKKLSETFGRHKISNNHILIYDNDYIFALSTQSGELIKLIEDREQNKYLASFEHNFFVELNEGSRLHLIKEGKVIDFEGF